MAEHCLRFTVTVKQLNYTLFCLTTAPQVADRADTTESEQTEALGSAPGRDADDLKTDKTEELRDKQSPRSPQHTEKVMLLKSRLCAGDIGCHVCRLRMQEMQDKAQGKTMDR